MSHHPFSDGNELRPGTGAVTLSFAHSPPAGTQKGWHKRCPKLPTVPLGSWSSPAPATKPRVDSSSSRTGTSSGSSCAPSSTGALCGASGSIRRGSRDFSQGPQGVRSVRGDDRARVCRVAAPDPRARPGGPCQAPSPAGRDLKRDESLEAALERSSIAVQRALAAPLTSPTR